MTYKMQVVADNLFVDIVSVLFSAAFPCLLYHSMIPYCHGALDLAPFCCGAIAFFLVIRLEPCCWNIYISGSSASARQGKSGDQHYPKLANPCLHLSGHLLSGQSILRQDATSAYAGGFSPLH